MIEGMYLTWSIKPCIKCKRRIVVERIINGSDHTTAVMATCADCLFPLPEENKTNYSDEKYAALKAAMEEEE